MFAWFAKLMLPDWVKKALAGAGVLAFLLAAFLIWDAFDDAGVRKDVRKKDAAATAQASQAANDEANQRDAIRQRDNALASEHTRKAITNAETLHSEAARLPAGPVSRAAADSLRERAANARAAAR